jgi:uncharacterized membrane protein
MEANTVDLGGTGEGAGVASTGESGARRRLQRPHLRGDRNVAEVERLLSVVGGGALALWGLRRRGASGTLATLAGAALVQRGATGHCPMYEALGVGSADGKAGLVQQHGPAAVLDASRAVRVEHAVTIARPREELYRFWRNLENLPRIMRHVEAVQVLDERRSHWAARAPAGNTVSWVAEIHNEVPGELLAWKSIEGATVPNAGSVHFRDAAGGGTEIRVILEYEPPAGRLGGAVAKLFHEEPDRQVREDLQRFKREMENGRG